MEVPESWREYACATVFNYSPRELDMILQVLSFSRQLVAALESHREELAGKLAGGRGGKNRGGKRRGRGEGGKQMAGNDGGKATK